MKQAKRSAKKLAPAKSGQHSAMGGPPDQPPALRPRRGLFIALMIVLAVWVAVLILLYLMTMTPVR